MTEAARRRIARQRIRLIKIQWLIILVLLVALIISLATRPAASVEESVPTIITAPSVSAAETEAPSESVQPIEPELIELGTFKTTAYCTCVKCCGIWSQEHPSRIGTDYVQKTASGTIPTAGRTVAVDTNLISYGTVLIIDGHEYIAEDTGSAVKGNVIDIYFDSHEDAIEYGVQYKKIYIKGSIGAKKYPDLFTFDSK